MRSSSTTRWSHRDPSRARSRHRNFAVASRNLDSRRGLSRPSIRRIEMSIRTFFDSEGVFRGSAAARPRRRLRGVSARRSASHRPHDSHHRRTPRRSLSKRLRAMAVASCGRVIELRARMARDPRSARTRSHRARPWKIGRSSRKPHFPRKISHRAIVATDARARIRRGHRSVSIDRVAGARHPHRAPVVIDREIARERDRVPVSVSRAGSRSDVHDARNRHNSSIKKSQPATKISKRRDGAVSFR